MFRSSVSSRKGTKPWISVSLLATAIAFVGGCHGVFGPLGGQPAAVPTGYVRAHIQVQMPPNKLSGMTVQATNDLRNQTMPAKMRLTVNGMDIAEPIVPKGEHVNPIPLSTQAATVTMLVPLGRNLVIKAEGLTADNQPIPSAVVKGVFDALVDQGTVEAKANRLTTPVAEVIEGLLAKQHLGPEEQKRSRNLLLSYDTAALQQFVLQKLLGATGNLTTDLQRFNDGKLLKHPGLINVAALDKYVWERAAVPPDANFLLDEEGRPAFLTPGKVKGTVTGLRPNSKVTILCDDPVSEPLVVEGNGAFEVPSVLPGQWQVHAHASGFRPMITHYTSSEPPAFYEAGEVPSGGERADMDFAFELIPPTVDSVHPSRGPFSPDLSNPAYVTINGQDFGEAQDSAVVVFRNQDTGAVVPANLIEEWTNEAIKVAVPTLAAGEYTVRIDKPAVTPGEMITGKSTATYAAATWRRLYAPEPMPLSHGNPYVLKAWRLGIATSDDLHARDQLFVGWDSLLAGLSQRPIVLDRGGTAPDTVFPETNTATRATAAWALHPDGRSLYAWVEDGKLRARAFGVSGVPLGGNYDLDASANASDCHAEAAAFDPNGVLHLAYSNRGNGIYYQRFRIDGLGVGTPVSAPLRVDEATAFYGTQDAPRLRLGPGGHVVLAWVDRRSGMLDTYFRVIKPDGTPQAPEMKRPTTINEITVDSAGNVVLYIYSTTGDKKLYRYDSQGALTGSMDYGLYKTGPYQEFNYTKIVRLLFDQDDRLIAISTINSGSFTGLTHGWYTFYSVNVDGYVNDGSGSFKKDTQRPSIEGFSALGYGHYGNEARESDYPIPVLGSDGTLNVTCRDPKTGDHVLIQVGWY